MTKRLVDIDDEVLARAREVLGTTTLKDTVNESLRRAVASDGRGIDVDDWEWFRIAAVDLGDPEVMRDAWA